MRSWRWLWALLILWIAAILQQGLANRMTLFGFRPDFLLAALGPLSLTSKRSTSTTFGFVAGWIQGVLAGANIAHYVVSRCLATFATASITATGLQIGLLIAGGISAGTTVIGQLVLMFLAPPHDILSFVGATIGTAAYNGVLAMPLYALLRRFADSHSV